MSTKCPRRTMMINLPRRVGRIRVMMIAAAHEASLLFSLFFFWFIMVFCYLFCLWEQTINSMGYGITAPYGILVNVNLMTGHCRFLSIFYILLLEHESFYGCESIYMVWRSPVIPFGLFVLFQLVGIGWIFIICSWVSKIVLSPVCCAH
jgi:hypothetical protein